MIDKIESIKGVLEFTKIDKVQDIKEETNVGFEDVVSGLLTNVNNAQIKSENSIDAFIKGDSNITMHQVMLDVKEGQMSLEVATTLRNNVVELYQEVNRMQL